MSASRTNDSGFSVIELLLVISAASVLALTIGTVVVFTWKGWQQARVSVEMQREMSMSLRVIAREVRESDPADLSGGTSLDCTSGTFAKSGDNLTFGNLNLVAGRLRNFSATVNGSQVNVTLALGARDDRSTVTATFYSRN